MWHLAIALEALWEGDLVPVLLGGQKVMVIRLPGGEIRAYHALCPHQGTELVDGELEGTRLTCSAHHWSFDLATGCGINPRVVQLTRYPVSIRGQHVFVAVPAEARTA